MASRGDAIQEQRQVVETGDVVVVCGLPGVGKSTVSRAIADAVDGVVLRTDVIRQEIVENPVYTAAEKRRVYDELFERAREHAGEGRTVVLDGTYRRRTYRDRARDLAAELDTGFDLVNVRCDEAVVEDRIAAREDDASEADFAVYEQYRDSFEPFVGDHLTVDNSGDLETTRRQVAQLF
ncbi:MAG: AAA family ATPase [Halobacteriales archaeon]|nr:AAA family ATPase [Halobacteriales archaeon]